MTYTYSPAALGKQLLDDYQAGDFFFSSPSRTLLGRGSLVVVDDPGRLDKSEPILARVAACLARARECGCDNPVIVGALPFDNKKEARLIIPERLKQAPPLTVSNSPSVALAAERCFFESVPSPDVYKDGVTKGLSYIARGYMSKLVLSRSLRITCPTPIDIPRLLSNLAYHNTHGYTFAVGRSDADSHHAVLPECKTFLGASPELLVLRSGRSVTANPLAGSRPRGQTPHDDKRLADELLASAKDVHEHQVVVNAVAAALRPYCKTLNIPDSPCLMHTETMWHLSTKLTGELRENATSSLELALALHPTPAVCGAPTEAARQAIGEIEPFDRGLFTGIVGWCDARGDGEWAVAIRCAEAEANSLHLYAGAGIVAGSKPEEELDETAAKFRTMLVAMGLNEELIKS